MEKHVFFCTVAYFLVEVVVVVVVEIQFICLIFMVTGEWYTRGWTRELTKREEEDEVKFNRINFTTIFKRTNVGMGFYNGIEEHDICLTISVIYMVQGYVVWQ